MSRLDDELRLAFRREHPPADFLERVMRQIAAQPAVRTSWWQRLMLLVQMPKARWVAVGVAASLLIAFGAIQYRNRLAAPAQHGAKVETAPAPSIAAAHEGKPDRVEQVGRAAAPRQARGNGSRPRAYQTVKRQVRRPLETQYQQARAQGEAAKERLLLALQIASVKLNEAQKMVQSNGAE